MEKAKEDRFRELINDLYTESYPVKIIDEKSNTIEFYNSKGKWLIYHNQKNGATCISYERIWLIFYKEYNLKFEEIQLFMKNMLFKHFNIKETTPEPQRGFYEKFVEKIQDKKILYKIDVC